MRQSLLEHLEDRVLLAGTPTLVADLNTNGLGSSPADFTVYGNALYFTAYDDTHGRALWRFDGSQATLAADIDPGPANIFLGPEELTVFKGALYFRASDSTHGIELWKYDGTSATLAADIKPNFYTDLNFNSSRPSGLTVIGDRLYFSADDGVSGREIWSFDGTTATRLADLNPGKGDSEPYAKPYRFTEFAGAMYFIANPGDNRDHLFKFDGQNIVRIDEAGGVPLLSEFYDDQLIVFGGALYFTGAAAGQNLDREFWKFDGNSFSRVADIRVGPDGSWPSGYFTFNESLYFWAQRFPSIGLELFKFDGVSVTPTGESRPEPQRGSTVLDGEFYRAGEHLFRFDGSHFTQLSDVPVGGDLATFGGAIYLAGQFQPNGLELARYDGESITLVADLRPGTDPSRPGNFSSFDGNLYFTADSNQSSHAEIWKSDGSGAQIADPSREYFLPSALVKVNGQAYFAAANDGDDGYDLWRYDGDHSTKVLGRDLNGTNIYPPQLGAFGNDLLFWGYGTQGPGEGPTIMGLWAFDGATARPIAPELVGNGDYSDSSSFTIFNGALYFQASEAYGGTTELWKFDGNSVVRAPGIAAGSLRVAPGMKVYDGALYFSASDQASGGLWKYDGTQATLAAEFSQGGYASYPAGFEIHEGSLYFGANDDQFGSQLWRYNSTAGVATRVTRNLTFGPSNLGSLAGVLYFFASTSASDPMSLWSYDGVKTEPVAPLLSGSSFFRFKGALYFGADDGLHGYELWKIEPDVPVGDLNRDGTVSIADFVTLSSNFGKSNEGWADGDVNYDGQVTIADFIELAANFGKSTIQPAAAAVSQTLGMSGNPVDQQVDEGGELPSPRKNGKSQHAKKAARHAHHRARRHNAGITLRYFSMSSR